MNMNDYRQVYVLYLRYSTNQTLTSSYHSSDNYMKFVCCKSSIKHDLQLLLRFSTLYPGSLWKIDTIMFAKFKYPPPPPLK